MTNFELYKDEILDIMQKTGGLFAVRIEDGAVRSCDDTSCDECLFNKSVSCFKQRKKWLEETGNILSKYKTLKKDTPVRVWNYDPEYSIVAHFCDIYKAKEEYVVRVYANGQTSYTTHGLLDCYRNMEIVKKGEE